MSDKEKDVAEEVREAPAGDTAAEQVQEAASSDARAEGDQPPLEHGELSALLEDARDKADEHWNQCLRLQADIENLRKRSERDLANAHKFALERFAQELLPVRDSLEMGIAARSGQAERRGGADVADAHQCPGKVRHHRS